MSNDEIILFDIPTRMLLNYKGLKYRTEWLEYPQIRTRLENHIPPPPNRFPPYTIPTILLPTGHYIMDSSCILTTINTLHPLPPLPHNNPPLPLLFRSLEPFMAAFRPIYVPGVAKNILNDASAEYFHRVRGEKIGMGLHEYEEKYGGYAAYEKMEPHLKEITALLGEDRSGPFFGGKEVAYVDFLWAGVLIFVEKVGQGVFEEVMGRSGGEEVHRGLLEAVKEWTRRDD